MQPVAKIVATLLEQADIWSLDFSPDGQYLAAAAPDSNEIHIWDWQGNGGIVRTLYKPRGTESATTSDGVRYSFDGRVIAAVHARASQSDAFGVVRIWNASTGHIVRNISEPLAGGAHAAIAFSYDSRLLMRTIDRPAKFPGNHFIVHRTDTWEATWGLRRVPFYPQTLALSPDARWVALGGAVFGPGLIFQPQLQIVDMLNRAVVRTIDLPYPQFIVVRLEWSPDGRWIVAGADRFRGDGATGSTVAVVFDAATGEKVVAESAVSQSGHVFALRYSPDGSYLIECGIGETTKIWDGPHRQLMQELPGLAGSLAISRNGQYLARGGARIIEIWELR
jgi:WD40 repeat protein